MRRLLFAAVIAALAAGGCAARAKTPVVPIALEAPAPPPRVIVPPEPEMPEPPAAAPERDAAAPKMPRRPPAATPPRAEARPESARPAPAVQPASPPGALQLALPMSPADLVRHVREQIAEAQSNLGRVDYLALGADGKSQYDTAKRFIDQAEQALREKNLVFAAKVAEKAAGLAASLAGRHQP